MQFLVGIGAGDMAQEPQEGLAVEPGRGRTPDRGPYGPLICLSEDDPRSTSPMTHLFNDRAKLADQTVSKVTI